MFLFRQACSNHIKASIPREWAQAFFISLTCMGDINPQWKGKDLSIGRMATHSVSTFAVFIERTAEKRVKWVRSKRDVNKSYSGKILLPTAVNRSGQIPLTYPFFSSSVKNDWRSLKSRFVWTAQRGNVELNHVWVFKSLFQDDFSFLRDKNAEGGEKKWRKEAMPSRWGQKREKIMPLLNAAPVSSIQPGP